MDGKDTAKKIWMKIGFGILFVAACFVAMYILMEFHEDVLIVMVAAVVLLLSAFLFLNAVFSDKAKKWIPLEEEEEAKAENESLSVGGDGEFRLKIVKHMKEMESTQKELIDVLKNQNTLIQSQIENLEHEIYMLSEKQVNQTKSVIKFNKENARQLAISERETLEYVMLELKKAIEDNAGGVRNLEAEEEEPDLSNLFATAPAAELEEISGEDFLAVSDLPGDDEMVMPDLPEMPVTEDVPPVVEEVPAEPSLEDLLTAEKPAEEIEIPEMPEDIDLSELFDIPELLDEPAEAPAEEVTLPEAAEETVPVVEEKPEEPAPAADPLAGLGGDPNAMMTPEDIAKLLEAMGQ